MNSLLVTRMDLRSCCNGDRNATVASLQCPKDFNLNSVFITRESLYRLCGFGPDAYSRYVDDQVFLDRGERYVLY